MAADAVPRCDGCHEELAFLSPVDRDPDSPTVVVQRVTSRRTAGETHWGNEFRVVPPGVAPAEAEVAHACADFGASGFTKPAPLASEPLET